MANEAAPMSMPDKGVGAVGNQMADEDKAKDFTYDALKNYYVNDGPKAFWMAIYGLANAGFFAWGFYQFATDEFEEVRDALGWGLPTAKACAMCIKFNTALLLFTVLRNFLSALRTTMLSKIIPFDKNIQFHKGIAWVILFFALAHTVAHYCNYFYIATNENPREELKFLIDANDPEAVAPTTRELAYLTVPGATGHILLLVMCFMYSSAIVSIRRPYFEAFWYTHHLFILFYFLICIHGLPGSITPPNAFFWLVGPMLFYALERGLRICRGNQDTVLLAAVQHPSNVLELRMKKTEFKYQPGMYLFLNCPFVSSQEWHPFTITSAPEQDFVSVHVRIVGDWTGAVRDLLNPSMGMGVVAEDIATAADGSPILRIDGPFGTASEEVFNYKTVVLVGGGIGVTPFASILKSIRYRYERQQATGLKQLSITKVYFFWIARDKSAFEWFGELLAIVEEALPDGIIDINIFLTAKMNAKAVDELMRQDQFAERDVITGLKSKTQYGRPNWDKIFDQLCVDHAGQEIGVFFCGPVPISKKLYQTSRRCTMDTSHATKIKFNKENF